MMAAMTTSPESPPDAARAGTKPAPKSAKDERAERLAVELRANLRRRKAQARGRDGAENAPAEPERPGED